MSNPGWTFQFSMRDKTNPGQSRRVGARRVQHVPRNPAPHFKRLRDPRKPHHKFLLGPMNEYLLI